MKQLDQTTKEYLSFMIGRKEIKGQSYRNRKASDFYKYLRSNANLYGISVLDQLKKDAYLIMKGIRY